MKPRSRKPSRAKRARPSARRSAGKYRWALLAVVSVLILAAAIWGWKRATHREDRPSTPLPSPVQTPKLHIESFLASLQDRSFQDVTDIKAEEKTLVETVVSDFPGRTGPLSLLAAVYHSHGDIEQAEQLWQKALAIAPAQPQIYLRLGLMAEESDQLDKAIAYWQQGLKLNPQAPNLRWHLANAMILQGRLEGTVELLQTECTLTPASARNYFLLGQVHLKQDAYEQAETCYEKALELQPEYFNAYYGLGKVYTRLRQPDKARECMQTFMKMKTQREGSEDLRIVLDEVPVARTRAAGLYRQASSLYGPSQRGTICQHLLERALILDPNEPRNYEKLGALHFQHRRFQTALTQFEKARQLDPNNPLFYLNIASLHKWMQQLDQAEATLKKALDRFPNHPLVHVEMARFYLNTRTNLPACRSFAQRAVKLEPSAENYFVLARACEANNDISAAAEAIEQALTLEPNETRYKEFHAYIRSKR